MKTIFDLSRDEITALTDEDISLYIDKELANKGIPIEAKNWNIKDEKEVAYPRTGVPVFMIIYVYNIKQERSYNNDMVGIFERYKDIADGDMEVAMNFIKEAYPFNEETEVFIRKKFNMSIPVEPEE